MKKVLLFFELSFLFSHPLYYLYRDRFESDRLNRGFYESNPNYNEILKVKQDYLVIRNLTAKSEIYNSAIDVYEIAEVFLEESIQYCKKNKFFNQAYSNGNIKLVNIRFL